MVDGEREGVGQTDRQTGTEREREREREREIISVATLFRCLISANRASMY